MKKCLLCFDYEIIYGTEVVKKGGFCIDASSYVAEHLECKEDDLDAVVSKTSEEELVNIAKWASSSCDYAYNILMETISEEKSQVISELEERLSEDRPDEYDDIYGEIYEDISHRLASVELNIDDKIYKGR